MEMDYFWMGRDDYMAICRDIYAQRARGDLETGLALFHENATYRLLGSRAIIPAAGLRVGKQEIREAWKAFDVDFEIVAFEVDDFAADVPRISYMSWHMTLRNRGTGALADIEGVDSIKWEDRKIVEWTRYFDTALVAALGQSDGHSEP
ncbi:nuclear transport factor 2 family protein [Rhodoblastus acidophilus]|nr:nuclear transport factor 2 family protein [Rhodoblastus acidophilus]RAI21797.1 nuclear transport factor 2 family protein [Rhodoblastus acidophilus]